LYNFKTKCVNMAWLYVLHVLKDRFWLKNDPVSKPFFVTQFGHYLSTIAHMLGYIFVMIEHVL